MRTIAQWWNHGYVGLNPALVPALESLSRYDRVRITGTSSESYAGYLFDPGLFSVKYVAHWDDETERFAERPLRHVPFVRHVEEAFAHARQQMSSRRDVYLIWYHQIRDIERL